MIAAARRKEVGSLLHKAAQQGFSVMEALVAIALIALAFVPLLELQGGLARTAAALERAERSAVRRESAVNYLSQINPMRAPEGQEPFGEATLAWRATPISEIAPVLDLGGQKGRFSAQLFQIDATLSVDGGSPDKFSITQMGWRADSSGLTQ